jgi:tetratricopeptide (TPR) repeat protein
VELEPGFADAWGQLALIEAALAERSAAIDRAQSTAIARQLAARAISLDPRSASGLAALATVKFYGEFNFQEAEEGLRAALEANPSASFLMQRYAMVLAAMSRLDEAVALAREAQRLEPTLAMRSTSLGILLYYARKYDEAAREMNRALLVTPAYPLAYFGLGKIASAQGRHAEAIRQLQRALAGSMNSVWLSELARAYAAANRPDDVSRVLAQLRDRERNGDGFSPDNLAYIAVAEGRFDEAFSILEDAIERRLANVLWIAVDPRVDPLRADPRFKQLIAKLTVVQ